jgi:hypothetical protein
MLAAASLRAVVCAQSKAALCLLRPASLGWWCLQSLVRACTNAAELFGSSLAGRCSGRPLTSSHAVQHALKQHAPNRCFLTMAGTNDPMMRLTKDSR